MDYENETYQKEVKILRSALKLMLKDLQDYALLSRIINENIIKSWNIEYYIKQAKAEVKDDRKE